MPEESLYYLSQLMFLDIQHEKVINLCYFQPEIWEVFCFKLQCNLVYPGYFRQVFFNTVLKTIICLFLNISKEMSQTRAYPNLYFSILRQLLKQMREGFIHALYRHSLSLHTHCISPPQKVARWYCRGNMRQGGTFLPTYAHELKNHFFFKNVLIYI